MFVEINKKPFVENVVSCTCKENEILPMAGS